MSEFSNFLEAKLVDHAFRATDYVEPVTVYVALFTAVTDGEAGTVTEVSGGAYARQAVTFGAGSQVGGAYEVSNSADITFPAATANWGTVTHGGIYDASTAGNLMAYTALDASKVVNSGDTFKFSAGNLKLSLA